MAIAASELRIGNWYNFANPMEGGKLSPSQFNHFSDYLDFEHYCEPIPLTPDILIACGFEKREDWDGLTWASRELILDEEMRPFFETSDPYYAGTYGVKVTTLHHLQNLIFSLTGKELNYSPIKK